MQPKQDLAGGQTLSSGVVGQQGPNYIYSIQGHVTRSFMAAFQPIDSIKVIKELNQLKFKVRNLSRSKRFYLKAILKCI